jgi:hypothetical protein
MTERRQNRHRSPVIHITRDIADLVRITMWVRAGGWCEFDGCKEYLLEHHVTLTDGNFAQFAHIVAFRERGPRGRDGDRPADINDVSNLMLLCPRCHKLIDDHPEQYTRATLEGYKKRHEQRIRHVTGLGADHKTSVLVLKSRIGEQTVSIPFDQILEAITPRYPLSKEVTTIDLTQIPATSPNFVGGSCDAIRDDLRVFFGPSGEARKTGHISVFGFATIPVLVFFGSKLSNKVPVDLYQRHRDTEDWTWKQSGKPVTYEFRQLRKGKNGSAALLLSLSGPLTLGTLPSEISGAIYELTLARSVPRTTFLRTRRDLEEFRIQYQLAIATIVRDNPGIRHIDLFPAVPAPIAILCGRELLPKAHPALRVFDFDKHNGGFNYQLTINDV